LAPPARRSFDRRPAFQSSSRREYLRRVATSLIWPKRVEAVRLRHGRNSPPALATGRLVPDAMTGFGATAIICIGACLRRAPASMQRSGFAADAAFLVSSPSNLLSPCPCNKPSIENANRD